MTPVATGVDGTGVLPTRGGEGKGPEASTRELLRPGREDCAGDRCGDLSLARFFVSPEDDEEDFFFLYGLEAEEDFFSSSLSLPYGMMKRSSWSASSSRSLGPGWSGSVPRRRPFRAGGSAPCLWRGPGRLTWKGGLNLHFHNWRLVDDESTLVEETVLARGASVRCLPGFIAPILAGCQVGHKPLEAVPILITPLLANTTVTAVSAANQVIRTSSVMSPRLSRYITYGEPGTMGIGTLR